MQLFYHPFSSYSQKAITAFYEKEIEFEPKLLNGEEPVASEFAALWPIGKFPVLRDGERVIFEATGIIEYLDAKYPEAPRLFPADPMAAAQARMWDRFFDNYVGSPQQQIIYASFGGAPGVDVAQCRAALETAYDILDRRMAARHSSGLQWASGEAFSIADCAAAPHLLYADWTHEIDARFSALRDYRARLIARPSYARALDEARPFRHLFPPGAPADRD